MAAVPSITVDLRILGMREFVRSLGGSVWDCWDIDPGFFEQLADEHAGELEIETVWNDTPYAVRPLVLEEMERRWNAA